MTVIPLSLPLVAFDGGRTQCSEHPWGATEHLPPTDLRPSSVLRERKRKEEKLTSKLGHFQLFKTNEQSG
jgi:hypothetical protein